MPCIRCNASLVVVVYAGEWNFWTRKRILKGVGTCWLVGIDKVFFRLLCFFINIFKQKLPWRKSSFKIDKKLHIKIQILFCIKLLYRKRNKFPWKFSPLSSHLCSKLALCKKHMSHDNKINWAFKPEKTFGCISISQNCNWIPKTFDCENPRQHYHSCELLSISFKHANCN